MKPDSQKGVRSALRVLHRSARILPTVGIRALRAAGKIVATLRAGAFVFVLLWAAVPASAQAGSTKFIPTFLVYYGGGPALASSQTSTLAMFDLIDTNAYRYLQIAPTTWSAIKSSNPNVQIYLYKMGPEFYNWQDSTTQEYINTLARYDVSRGHPMGSLDGNQPQLFLLDSAGSRIYNVAYSTPSSSQYSYLMDFGSSSYQSYWVIAEQADIVSQPWVADGVFTDNCLALASGGGYSATSTKYPTNAAWSAAMNSFASAITAGMHGYGQKLWCNRGSSGLADGSAAWLSLDASATPPDVLMEEGAFAVSWGSSSTQFYPEASWKLQVDTMAAIKKSQVAMLSHTKLAPDQSGTDNWGQPVTFWQTLWYSLGSFLLGKNDTLGNAYFMFHGSDNQYNAVVRYPEYDNINLGKALGPYTVTTIGGVNVYWREFEKGYVYVNPTATNVPTVSLPQLSQQITHANLLSPLSSIPTVSTIALNGHNAAILLKAATTSDTTPPTVSITSPSGGSTVGGTIALAASASDNVGVAGVQFLVDGASVGAEDTVAPYSISWDTTTVSNAAHTVAAVARDAAGNAATSAPVTVTVYNAPPPDTTPPSVSITAPAGGATVSGTVAVTASASDNVGVVGVQFLLDGANLGAEVTAAPYSVSWSTSTASNGSHTLSAVARDAAGNRTTSAAITVTVSNASKSSGTNRRDFNGDGKADILWRNSSTGADTIWLMNGTTISGNAAIATVADSNWKIMGGGDFNGDGKADILWRNSSTGANAIWFMNGTVMSSSAYTTAVTDLNWSIAGTGDFDGDGKTDILWRNSSTGADTIWLMNGTTISGNAAIATVTNLNWKIVGVGDFNGDGKADILWRNISTGANAIWFMNGTAMSSSAYTSTVTDLNWSIAGTGDFDGDGKADILWRNSSTGADTIWLMNGTTISGNAAITAVTNLNWKIVEVGDFDGDGKADILWRNISTGANAIWFMNGTAMSSSAYTNTVTDLNWAVQ